MSLSGKVLLLVFASLPLQLNKFFFFDFSYVLGIPIDYRAASIYLSDFLIVLYIAISAVENVRDLKKIYIEKKGFINSLICFNLYLFISTAFLPTSMEVPFIFSLKILELSLFAIFLSHQIENIKILNLIKTTLLFSSFWQFLLILLQMVNQGSLGLWFLGERTFDVTTSGIAHTYLLGSQILRPYGTFPHPNVLGAFFVFSTILTTTFAKGKKQNNQLKILWFFSLASACLSFSKTALSLIFILIFTSLAKPKEKIISSKKTLAFKPEMIAESRENQNSLDFSPGKFIFLIITGALFLEVISNLSLINSVAERILLLVASLDISRGHTLFGVGSGNFVLELSNLNIISTAEVRLIQPVHNVFLLILSENGIVGLFLFTLIFYSVHKQIVGKERTLLFIYLLVYLSTDHFLWTLQQGQMLLFITLAYLASPAKKLTS